MDPSKSIEDAAEARRTVPVLLVTILIFLVHKPLHLEPATAALAGAAVTLLVSRQSLQGSIASIEWLTLFFLIGLFVMVAALEGTGALKEVTSGIASVTGGDRVAELLGILWVSAIGSGVAASGMAARAGHPHRLRDLPALRHPVTLASLLLATAYVALRYT